MKRTILFRGKRVDTGEWCYGVPLVEGWSKTTYIASYEYSSLAFVQQIEVIPETLCQFTGLCDKNGNRIFEGDIVRDFIPFNFTLNGQKLYKENIYIVEYSNKKCGFSPFCEEGYDGIPIIEECVIIGNIHDNPELLTAERKE